MRVRRTTGSIYFNGVAGKKDYEKSYELFAATASQIICDIQLGCKPAMVGTDKDVDLAIANCEAAMG